ncbi:MAG: hypothetical protein EHM12_00495 [Dehalococcoidia bacterium]|nr:MAG: hypothetical protein EHM12_00495 [Dehalococcoidia bacterium]
METLISFDEQQTQKLEQIILDHDEVGAIKFLEELSKKIKRKKIGCDPLEFKAREGIENIINEANKSS